MKEKLFTDDDYAEFDRLTMNKSSFTQTMWIAARLELGRFVKFHGKEKCDAMWAGIQAKEAKNAKRRATREAKKAA